MKKTIRLAAVLPLLTLPAAATPMGGSHNSGPMLPKSSGLFNLPDAHRVDKPLPTDRIGLYVRASRLIESVGPAVDPADDASPPQDAKGWAERYSLKRKDAWLRHNAGGFALFEKALKAPLRPGTAANHDPLSDGFATYGTLRQLARELIADVHAREMRGDWGGAAQRRLDILQVGNDIGTGGTLIDALVGMAIQSIGMSGVSNSSPHLTLPEARAAAERLSRLYGHRLRLVSAMEGDKKFGLQQWKKSFADPEWRDPNNFTDLSPAQRAELLTISPAAFLSAYGAEMDRQINLAQQPYERIRKRPQREPTNLISAVVFSSAGAAYNFARTDTGHALWLVSFALEAYKLERGAYPATLRGLVPGFLPRVPIDPFSGVVPIHYKRRGDSYLLWSIGPDGVDDGGEPVMPDKAVKVRRISPAAPPQLPGVYPDSRGDFVAGRNQ